jgi:HlyD family secretion protein
MSPDSEGLDALRIDRSGRRKRRWVLWIPVLLVPALAAAAVLWAVKRSAGAAVRTAVVREAVLPEGEKTVLNASGYVTARRQATISSKVTGKVVEVSVEEGLAVAEGQVLARLDSSNVSAQLRLSEAQLEASRKALEETRVRLAEARIALGRARKLVTEKIASQADLDSAQAEADSLAARLEQQKEEVTVSEKQVAFYRQELEDTVIRAPFAGIVVSKNAQPGEMISPISAGGGFTRTGICTIVDMSSLEIEVDVNEGYINRVVPGQPVRATLDAYPDWKIPARVIAIVPTADRQKATVRVRIGFEELDPRILPDMGVKVAFKEEPGPGGQRGAAALIVPRSALRKEGGRDIVFGRRNGRAERRAVSIGEMRDDGVVLSAGVSAGERVVVEGPETLSDGDRIEEEN